MDTEESFIDRELKAIGWPSLSEKTTTGTIFSLLKQRSVLFDLSQRDCEYRDDLMERIAILNQEQSRQEAAMNKISARLEVKIREKKDFESQIMYATFLLRKLDLKFKEASRALITAKDEAKKSKISLISSKSQYEHEIRKFHLEKQRFKDKISRLVSEKVERGVASIQYANPLTARATILSKDKVQQMYNIVAENYEDKEKEMMLENSALRQLLLDFHYTVEQKLEETSNASSNALNHSNFQLPIDMIRDPLLSAMTFSVEQLCIVAAMNGTADQVEELQLKIEQQVKEIEEQKVVLDVALSLQLQETSEEEAAKKLLAEQWKELKDQQSRLTAERSSFTDAAIKLGLERANLLRERKEYDEIRVVKQQIDQTSTPTWLKSKFQTSMVVDESKRRADELKEKENMSVDESEIMTNTPVGPRVKKDVVTETLQKSLSSLRKQRSPFMTTSTPNN